MSEFLAMGGYGLYVWGAYGISALAIAVEIFALRARTRAALAAARATPVDADDAAVSSRARHTTAGDAR